MTIGAHARRTAFWALDAARGHPVRRHLDDIRDTMAGAKDPEERLQPLLEHAIHTTPFYADVEAPRLDAFPVITRSLLQRQTEAFHSAALADARIREVYTSGSSGRPLTVRQDRDKRLRSIADTIHINETCGQLVGDPLLWLRAWPSPVDMVGLARRAQNITAFEVRGLDDVRMQAIVDTLRDRPINAMLAYTSALHAIVRFVQGRAIDARAFGLRVIINDSEAMTSSLKRELELTFGCPVADRYANAENGMLAAVAPGRHEFLLNRASFVFEFLDLDADRPQPAGKPARVVVTDLYNYAMPLIRYDTGDLAVVTEHGEPSPTSFHHLEGRRMDLVHDTAGRIVSSTMVKATLDPFDGLGQYQLRQLDEYAFRLLVSGADGVYTSEELTGALKHLLGSETSIVIDHVSEVPAETSGKARALVPLEDPRSQGG